MQVKASHPDFIVERLRIPQLHQDLTAFRGLFLNLARATSALGGTNTLMSLFLLREFNHA